MSKKDKMKAEFLKTVAAESTPSYREEHSVLLITIKEFSNENIHTPECQSSRYIDYTITGHDLDRDFPITVYPNGRDSSTEGHVSVEFYPGRSCLDEEPAAGDDVELTCVLSVVDAEGLDCFSQSYAFCGDSKDPEFMERTRRRGEPYFLIRNYISRGSILSRSEQLLSPDDTLTLRMHVVLREYLPVKRRYGKVDFEEMLKSSFRVEEQEEGEEDISGGREDGKMHRRYLRLDSQIAECLREESEFFERMSLTPMAECISGYVRIPDEFHDSFQNMLKILLEPFYDIFLMFTLNKIFSVYTVADFYGVASVLETCRRWLKIVCRTPDDVSAISRHAELYGDDRLLEIAESLSRNGEDPEADEVWTFRSIEVLNRPKTYFIFGRRSEEKGCVVEDKNDVFNSYL